MKKIEEGVWSVISTPFESRDFTTVCNGGIIQGEKGVLAVESFMQPKGATWLAEKAKELTGRWPTDVVSTHYHADHTGGHLGYFTDQHNPRIWLTESTKTAAQKSFLERGTENNNFKNVSTVKAEGETIVDLGNRKVRLVSRSGHTANDVTIELVDPNVIWCGDLFFNRMFPNYGDAIPSRLNAYAKSLLESKDTRFVPGHGPIADIEAVKKYQEFLSFIEESATKAFVAGDEIEASTKDFKLPESLSEWLVWAPDNAKKAYAAWYKELEQKEN